MPGRRIPKSDAIRCTDLRRQRAKGRKKPAAKRTRKAVEAYRQEKDEYLRLVYLRHEAIQKLTKDEIEALRELGI